MTDDKKSKLSEMNKNPAGNTRPVKERELNEGLQGEVREGGASERRKGESGQPEEIKSSQDCWNE